MNNKPARSGDGGEEEASVVVRTDSGFKKHTIILTVSDQEVGKTSLKVGEQQIELPTYKLTVTDDKTEETKVYQVTRDTLSLVKSKVQKSFLSFFGFKRFDKTSFLYENIAFEPQLDTMERFDISRYRKLKPDILTYEFRGAGQEMMLYAGDLNCFIKPEHIEKYFIIVDNDKGKSFIGDILFREQFLKLTPEVALYVIKRKQVAKNVEYDEKGHIKKLIYL